jgi:hypothetical protein
MTPAEYVDQIIATETGRDLISSSGAASDILTANGVDPLNTEHRRLIAIGAVIGAGIVTTNGVDGYAMDGFVRSLAYGMEPAS